MADNDFQPYGTEEFRRYQAGEMSPREQYLLEKRMLEDPLTAEAYEGFLAATRAGVRPVIVKQELDARLSSRLARTTRWWPYAAAASIVVAVCALWLLYPTGKLPVPKQHHTTADASPASPGPAAALPATAPAHAPADASVSVPAEPPALAATRPARQATAGRSADTSAAADALVSEPSQLAQAPPVPPVITIPPAPFSSQANAARDSMIRSNRISAHHIRDRQVLFDSRTLSTPRPGTPLRIPDKDPVPVGGWRAYNQYLYESTKNAASKGVVTITFTVGSGGVLSGFYMLGEQKLFAAASELIRKGPAWTPALVSGQPADKPVTITLHFELK